MCRPKVHSVSADGKNLLDGGHLDKADTDGVEKKANASSQRWDAANKHLNERQHKWVAFSCDLVRFATRRPAVIPRELE